MALTDWLDEIGTVGGFLLGGPVGAAAGRTLGGLVGGESEGVGGMLRNAAQGFGMGSLGTAIPGVKNFSGALGSVAAPTAPTPAVAGSSVRPPATGGGVPAITAPGAPGNVTVPPMTAPAAPTPAAPERAGGGLNVGGVLRDIGGFVEEHPMAVAMGLQGIGSYSRAAQEAKERERAQRADRKSVV